MQNNNIPSQWVRTNLNEIILTLESGRRPKGGVQGYTDGIPSLGGEHLNDSGGFKLANTRYVPVDFALSMTKGIIETEDILVVKDGATTGKTSFVGKTFPFENAVINEHLFCVKLPSDICRKWVFYQLWSQNSDFAHILESIYLGRDRIESQGIDRRGKVK